MLSRLSTFLRGVIFDSVYRDALLKRIYMADEIHQVASYTKPNRYPDLFRAAQAHFGANAPLSILSFGCSTGEEAFALRKYFPAARIVGVDINEQALAAARHRNQDANIHFLYSSPEHLEVHAPYDAVFCLNVLQRSGLNRGWVRSSRRVYPFERFDEQVKALDAVLKPGGLLTLFRSNYRLFDSSVGYKYTTLPGSSFTMYDKARKYDRRNRCIGKGAVEDVLFVKRQDPSEEAVSSSVASPMKQGHL